MYEQSYYEDDFEDISTSGAVACKSNLASFSQCRYRLIDTKSMEVQTELQSWKILFLFLENSQAVTIVYG